MSRVKAHVPAAGTFLFLLGVYAALTLFVFPAHVFFSGDEGIKFIQLQSLVRQNWRVFSLEYPGRTLDPDLRFFPIPGFSYTLDKELYFHFPLAFAAMSSVPYALLGTRGLYWIPSLSTLLTVVVVYSWTRRYAPRWAVVSVPLLGLATPLFFYSLLLWEHTLTVLLVTLAVYLLSQCDTASRSWKALAAGVALGLACWLRSEFYLFVLLVVGAWVAVFVLGLGEKRQGSSERLTRPIDASAGVRAWTALQPVVRRASWRSTMASLCLLGAGLAISLVPLWLWQQAVYGDPLGPQLGWHVESGLRESGTAKDLARNVLEVSYTTLVQGYPGRNPTVFLAIAFDLMVVVLWLPRLRRHPWLVLFSGTLLALASLPALVYARQHVIRGLLPVSPMAAFALVPLGREQERNRARLTTFLITIVLSTVVVVCLLLQVDPGLQWGPRVLLPLYPLLAVAALNSLTTLEQAPTRRAIVTAFVVLAVLSLILQLAGVRLLHRNKLESLNLLQGTADLPTIHIVTEVNWYVPEVASLFYERQFFYVGRQADFEELVERFYQAGVRQLAWVPLERSGIRPLVTTADYAVRQRSELIFEIVPLNDVR